MGLEPRNFYMYLSNGGKREIGPVGMKNSKIGEALARERRVLGSKFLFRRPSLKVRNPSKAHARAELFPFGLGLGTRKGVRVIDEEGRTGGSRDGKGLL